MRVARLHRSVGSLFVPDVGPGDLYKFRVHGRRRFGARQGRSDGVRPPRCRRRPRRVVTESSSTSGATPTGSRPARQLDPHSRADERVRGTSRVVAPRTRLPRTGGRSSPRTSSKRVSPTSNCFPSPSTRSAGPGAIRSRRTTPRPRDSAHPTTSAGSSTGFTPPASASSSTGFRRTSPRTSGHSPDSTARRSTSTPIRSAASSWTGVHTSSTSVDREVRNFLVANALFWLDEFHIDGLRVDAVASMLYLDYSRPDGGWTPNIHGGRENLEAVAFLQEMNATVHKQHRRGRDGRRGIDGVARRHPRDQRRRPRVHHEMEHGLDARHPRITWGATPSTAAYHHHEITFSLMYAWSENYLLPISHDEVVHGKGTLWTRMPGDDFATKAAGRPRTARVHVGAPGQAIAVHGPGVRPDAPNGPRNAASTGGNSTTRDRQLHRGVQRLVGDLNCAYRRHPAMWTLGHLARRLLLDRRQRHREQRPEFSALRY